MNDTMNVGTEECAVCTHTSYAAGYLREIANGRAPENTWHGLCYNLAVALRDAGIVSLSGYDIVRDYAPLWPEYSGNPVYPVPCQDANDEHCAYDEVDLWVGEYGAARRRLAGFIADCLEKELG